MASWANARTRQTNFNSLRFFRCCRPCLKLVALRQRQRQFKKRPFLVCLPALLLAVVAVPTIATIFKLEEKAPRDEAIQITAVGKQWWWEFEYAADQPKFGIDRKIVTSTMMHVPVGAKITLRERSDNVIHSFWVPQLSGKIDNMPGHENHLWFTPTEVTDRGRAAIAEFETHRPDWMPRVTA